jgi:hypothetical protein
VFQIKFNYKVVLLPCYTKLSSVVNSIYSQQKLFHKLQSKRVVNAVPGVFVEQSQFR